MNNQEILDMNHKTEQLTATESQKITLLENGNLMTVSDEGSYMGLFENKDCGDVWLTFDITEVIRPQYIRSLADIKRIVELEKCGWIMEESKSILTAHGGSTVLILFKSEMDGITIDNGQTVDISFMRSDTQIITISERYEPDAILAWKKIQGLAPIEALKEPKP